MACPVIPYGVPSSGAKEYNVNSGRELFRCGTACTKLYIVNVSLECNTVNFGCKSISDAGHDDFCMQSANATARHQTVVNWQAKENADSSLPSGYVINKAEACEGEAVVCTHVEGNLSARVLVDLNAFGPSLADEIKTAALNKVGECGTGETKINALDWVLSDLNVNVSPTDWQSGTVTFLGFASSAGCPTHPQTTRVNFSWQNGRYECAEGIIIYDESDTPQLLSQIISDLINECGL